VEYLTILVYLFLREIFKSLIICTSHFFLSIPLSSELRDDQCDPYRGDPEGSNKQQIIHCAQSCILSLHTFYVVFILVFFNNERSMV
jgi:hypothetical protein